MSSRLWGYTRRRSRYGTSAHHTSRQTRQGELWRFVRNKVIELLDARGIKLTSVDFVRFRWMEHTVDSVKTVTTPVTIWIGVLPDSLTADVAFDSCNDILQSLEKHDIFDIEVAYRESMAKPLNGPELYAPVSDHHLPKNVINLVTTRYQAGQEEI
jgi:hypothetical protein